MTTAAGESSNPIRFHLLYTSDMTASDAQHILLAVLTAMDAVGMPPDSLNARIFDQDTLWLHGKSATIVVEAFIRIDQPTNCAVRVAVATCCAHHIQRDVRTESVLRVFGDLLGFGGETIDDMNIVYDETYTELGATMDVCTVSVATVRDAFYQCGMYLMRTYGQVSEVMQDLDAASPAAISERIRHFLDPKYTAPSA